jgi:hypothetical protein
MASNGRRMQNLSTNTTTEMTRDSGKRMDVDRVPTTRTTSTTSKIHKVGMATDQVQRQHHRETMDMRTGKAKIKTITREATRSHNTIKVTVALDHLDGITTIKAHHNPDSINMTRGTVLMDPADRHFQNIAIQMVQGRKGINGRVLRPRRRDRSVRIRYSRLLTIFADNL